MYYRVGAFYRNEDSKATICSFGYVISDESFKIQRREDIVINPQGRFYLTGRAGRPDVHLAYPEATFKRAPSFDKFYNKIKTLVENKEYCIVALFVVISLHLYIFLL